MSDDHDPRLSDPDAENALLAACLWSKTARQAARRTVTGEDFYSTAAEFLWDAMSALDRGGRNVDPVTLNAWVAASGALPGIRASATALVLDITAGHSSVPDNAGEYAAIIRGWAIRRRLQAAGIRLQQQSMDASTPPTQLASTAVRVLTGIRDHGAGEDVTALTLSELMDVPDSPPEWVIPDLLERGDRLMLTGSEGAGKALALDTPVPTPGGWTTMGALAAGDVVFSPSGAPVKVVATTPPMTQRPCYRVEFSDGAAVVADAGHLWLTETLRAREAAAKAARRPAATRPRGTDQQHKRTAYPAVMTTRAIADTMYARDGHTVNHSVAATAPLCYPRREQPLDPYVLGVWLGDGTSASAKITSEDDTIPNLCAATGLRVTKGHGMTYRLRLPATDHAPDVRRPCATCGAVTRGWWCAPCRRDHGSVHAILRTLGVLGDKHVPASYLHADPGQRLALLQGLMDTDGTIGKSGACEFSVVSERLARDVHELVLGLGIKATWREAPAMLDGRTVGTRYRIGFVTDLPVFRLPRKRDRQTPLRTRRGVLRYITAVERVESVPVRCIEVAAEDGMFVVGRECIPTHNSALSRQLGIMAAAGVHPFSNAVMPPIRAAFVDCENKAPQVRRQTAPLLRWLRDRDTTDPTGRVMMDFPGRIDLARDRDLAAIHRLLDAAQPDLLVIGPMYRMSSESLNDEKVAHHFLSALDTIMARGVTLIIEAHAGHSTEGQDRRAARRALRPRGSSSLLGWPEFGLGLRAIAHSIADLEPWRGGRETRAWPTRMRRAAGNRWEETYPDDQGQSPPPPDPRESPDWVPPVPDPQGSLIE